LFGSTPRGAQIWWKMEPLRTTVIMKTDIGGSTSRFRELLAADLQTLLSNHLNFIAQHSAGHGGRIIKAAGDGYWLEFSSATGAARAAVEMQEALRLAQPSRGDDRLAIRIVIALGDIALQDGDFIGDAFALATRIEAVTPPDEIYLAAAARLALVSADVPTTLVNNFTFKGFDEPIPVYRIEQRHRTRVIADTILMYADLVGFRRITNSDPDIGAVERVLDALDTVSQLTAREYCGRIDFNQGDAYYFSFAEASRAVAGAECFAGNWEEIRRRKQISCAINIGLHRGTIYAYRSFLYGHDGEICGALQNASAKLLASDETGIFVTEAVRADLVGGPWHNRLQRVTLREERPILAGIEIYRLCDVLPTVP
jgi:class 3 adenylate cyclase